MLLLWILAISLTAGLAQAGAEGVIRVNPETLSIIDAEGRERFFHGVNVVVKKFPWIPEGDAYPFNETDMQRLQKLGLNSLRLVHNLVHASDTLTLMIWLVSCNENLLENLSSCRLL